MKSRLLLRLEAEIKACKDPLEVDCLRAERACYLARIGEVDEATAVVADLHRRYGHRQAAIAVWSSLVEAMVSHFSDMGPLAHDRIRRAHALSTATGLTRLQALSAAWLAHMCYSRLDIAGLARYVGLALALSRPAEDDCRARVCLVVAQAFHLAGRLDLAIEWYVRTKDHANRIGDDATLSALIHNQAWLRMSDLRQVTLTGSGSPSCVRHALMGVESVMSFDRLVGSTSLADLQPILRAQVLSLQGHPKEALALYKAYLLPARKQGAGRLMANLIADVAWCRCELGCIDEGRTDALLAVDSFTTDTQIDDRAAAHSRLAQVFNRLGEVESAAHHKRCASEAWAKHISLQAEILTALTDIVDR